MILGADGGILPRPCNSPQDCCSPAGRKAPGTGCSNPTLQPFPVGAVFYTLTKIQNNKAFTGNDWLVIFGILLISLVVRMVFKYLVYSFQSTAGFEFVSRERITLGDKLRNVGMGFFHERNMGDITTTVTTDLNFLENYSMHILDRVATGMVNMVVISIFILMFDWRLGVIFILGVLCSFLIYGRMQEKGEELTAKQRQVQAASVEARQSLQDPEGMCNRVPDG